MNTRASSLLTLAVIAGCATVPPPPPTRLELGGGDQAAGGVTSAARAIPPTNLSEFSALKKTIQYDATHHITVTLIPLPAFVVRIVNHSGAPLRLGGGAIRVEAAGKKMAVFDGGGMQARVEADLIGAHQDLS